MNTKFDRFRFKTTANDYRPAIWPPLGPYWCSGQGDNYSIIVAYFPHRTTMSTIKQFWPEAEDIDLLNEDTSLAFSDRFAKPTWWKE